MIFLFGETLHTTAESAGEFRCGSCGGQRPFRHVVETRWFTVFGLRVLRLETEADYYQCGACGTAFRDPESETPAHYEAVIHVVNYILLGYGAGVDTDLAQRIASAVAGSRMPDEVLLESRRKLASGSLDIYSSLKSLARNMDGEGKHLVIQAAFLATHVCCEMEYEDRLRVNMIGTALGASLPFTQTCIEAVRARGYYGVQRVLPRQSVADRSGPG